MDKRAIRSQGFTLIELILSIGIITLIAGLSLPVYQSFQGRNNLATTTQHLVEMLRRAETYARGSYQGCRWGVHFQASAATLFCGTTYASRTSSFDETVAISSDVMLSYNGEILFAPLSGAPATVLTQTLTGAGNTQTITINSKGVVDV